MKSERNAIRGKVLGFISLFLMTGLPRNSNAAQVTSLITASGNLGTTITQAGSNSNITGGTRNGSNLFHSFGLFNVSTGETANFSNDSGLATTNILGRVTNGQQSNIFGTIRTTNFGAASLFLINPAGWVFGPTASLNVGGSFHVSTADYLKFATDDAKFHADLARESVLTTAPVSAFGFLNSAPGAISSASTLAVPQGQTLSIVGGNIDLTGGVIRAPAGRINIGSVASPGEVLPNPALSPIDLNTDSFATLGNINLRNTGVTVSNAAGGGTVVIRGGRFALDQTGVVAANTQGNVNGAPLGIDVRVRENLTLSNGAQFQARTTSGGNGGNVEVQATDILISNTNFNGAFTGIATDATLPATGKAGNVKVTTGNLTIIGASQNGTDIHSDTLGRGQGGNVDVTANEIVASGSSAAPFVTGIFARAFSSGNGGDLRISANSVKMTDHARAQAISFGSGNTGNMTVTAKNNIELRDGSNFGASSVFGTGNAGSLNVTADNILISGIITSTEPLSTDFTGLTNATNAGFGPKLKVVANNIQVLNRGMITSSTAGSGNAGNVNLKLTGDLDVADKGIVSTGTSGSGNAGNINVQLSGALRITDGGTLIASSLGSGAGGSINIGANRVTVSGAGEFRNDDRGASSILSQAGVNSSKAGDVNIITDTLQVLNGGAISTETFGSAQGGKIEIRAQNVLISGINRNLESALIAAGFNPAFASANISSNSGTFELGSIVTGQAGSIRLIANDIEVRDGGKILAGTSTFGNGGNINLVTERLSLDNQALISVSGSGKGDAGDISIAASEALRSVNSSITSRTLDSDGGNIHLTIGNLLELVNSQITTSVQGGAGAGGNITIDPQFVVLNNSHITADAFGGPGGKVTIVADNLLKSTDSTITASSALSTPGTIDIQAPITDLSGSLAPLPEAIVQATSLLRQSCASRYSSGKLSSLASPGRGGMPFEPGSLMPSSLFQLADSSQNSISQDHSEPAHALIAAARPSYSIVSPCGKLY